MRHVERTPEPLRPDPLWCSSSSPGCPAPPGPGHTRAPHAAPQVAAFAAKKRFASFDEMVQGSDRPILVDFYATWCGPCQMMSGQILPAVKNLLGDSVTITKVDTEKC